MNDLSIQDIAGDVIKKYKKRYKKLSDELENKIENNDQYREDIKKKKNQELREKAVNRAEQLRENYYNELEKEIQKKKNDFENQEQRELKAQARKTTEEKILDKIDLLLTQQIINSGNEQLIRDHTDKAIEKENKEAVRLASYYYANQDGNNKMHNKINDLLASPAGKINNIKNQVNHAKAVTEVINFFDGLSRNIREDFKETGENHYF